MSNKGLKAQKAAPSNFPKKPPLTPPKGELGMPGGPYGFQVLQKIASF